MWGNKWKRLARDCQARLLFAKKENELHIHNVEGALARTEQHAACLASTNRKIEAENADLKKGCREREEEAAALWVVSENWREAWTRQLQANTVADREVRKLRGELGTAKERLKLEKRTSDQIDTDLRARLDDVEARFDRAKRRLREVNDAGARRITEREELRAELARVTEQREALLEAVDLCHNAAIKIGYTPEPEEVGDADEDKPPFQSQSRCKEWRDCTNRQCPHWEVHDCLLSVTTPGVCRTAGRKVPCIPVDPPLDPEPAPTPSPYEQFAAEVKAAGLTARDCGGGHWQIRGGVFTARDGSEVYPHPIVNVWPETGKGFRMAVGVGKGQPGSVKEAIKLAKGVVNV